MRILILSVVAAVTACAAQSGKNSAPYPALLTALGPNGDVTVVLSRTPTGPSTVAHFRLDEPGSAMLAEVRDGSVRVLFPRSVDSSTWMGAKVGRSVELSSDAGAAIYLIARKGPLDLGVVTEGISMVDWDARKYAGTTDPDSAILRFAAEVAGSLYTVRRAAWVVGGTVPFQSDSVRRHTYPALCRTQARPAPSPAPRDTVMRPDDRPRDPAADRVVCERP